MRPSNHPPPPTLGNKRQKRVASPAPGSLQEPGAKGLRGAGAGGKREGGGWPKGALGKAGRRARALKLREELVKVYSNAFSLTPRRLEEVLRAWQVHEPELAKEVREQFCNKSTSNKKSKAAKKIKRAREAESKARGLEGAAFEFRAESIAYFDRVLEDARKAIDKAARTEDGACAPEEDLSNCHLGHVVQVSMTLIQLQLYTHQKRASTATTR